MASGRRCFGRRQTAASLPLITVPIPSPCPNEVYEQRMAEAVAAAVARRLHPRRVRRSLPARRPPVPRRAPGGHRLDAALPAVGPANRRAGARDDPRRARGAFDAASISASCRLHSRAARSTMRCSRDLPAGVDPCGERGEFHSCVVSGPMFERALDGRGWRGGRARGFRLRGCQVEEWKEHLSLSELDRHALRDQPALERVAQQPLDRLPAALAVCRASACSRTYRRTCRCGRDPVHGRTAAHTRPPARGATARRRCCRAASSKRPAIISGPEIAADDVAAERQRQTAGVLRPPLAEVDDLPEALPPAYVSCPS